MMLCAGGGRVVLIRPISRWAGGSNYKISPGPDGYRSDSLR
jgi:hypothetical protein